MPFCTYKGKKMSAAPAMSTQRKLQASEFLHELRLTDYNAELARIVLKMEAEEAAGKSEPRAARRHELLTAAMQDAAETLIMCTDNLKYWEELKKFADDHEDDENWKAIEEKLDLHDFSGNAEEVLSWIAEYKKDKGKA
ncbi:hypothetical protein OPT61_g6705 [Boeremia exigua]|uniref:Uncharacterized protein n=1 Tax=Boeremia exigua TaxID=749465 RepID=A0ACC2I633_9PLEO|nr:hypothetical protein OPT61_g6705 [Boeremia exigua]